MFGLEILDIVIGLTFVYLLLSLVATAINEYIASKLNQRGKELAKGLARLLDDIDGNDAVERALEGVSASARKTGGKLVTEFYSHRLIRPLATSTKGGKLHLPSYIPARSFALALLDILEYHDPDAERRPAKPDQQEGAAPDGQAITPATVKPDRKAELAGIIELLKRESPLDVSEHLGGLEKLLMNPGLDPAIRTHLMGAVASTQTRLQKLHDSTEVWFNNSMDRVSGAYKRYTQRVLLTIGIVLAVLLNADTVQMWKTLAENDALRTAMADRAVRLLPALDTMVNGAPGDTAKKDVKPPPASQDTGTGSAAARTGGTTGAAANQPAGNSVTSAGPPTGATPSEQPTAPTDSAKAPQPIPPDSAAKLKYLAARAMLDSMELKLGWTREDWAYLGFKPKLASADSKAKNATEATAAKGASGPQVGKVEPRKLGVKKEAVKAENVSLPTYAGRWLVKIFGLLMTGFAISLGAPFWFDMLNKVISIRAAGRSPVERPKSPEGKSKRVGEQEPR
jgi:hypothetical protein